MPQIDLISPVYFNANDPYFYLYDNLPLKNIIDRQVLINLALDNVIEQMNDAVGTQNTVSNRLNQSINPDGSLKKSAVDGVMHTMDDHTDTDNYVRMSKAQSDKLAQISDNANDLKIQILDDQSWDLIFDGSKVVFEPSDTVTFHVSTPQNAEVARVSMNLAFPAASAHKHYYDQVPVADNLMTPDYINYKVNSIASPFIDGTLRVYVNGIRLSESQMVYVPAVSDNTTVWTHLKFTSDYANGRFSVSSALSIDDVIIIDYDTSFT